MLQPNLSTQQLRLLEAWERAERIADWLQHRAFIYGRFCDTEHAVELRRRAAEWQRRALDWKAEYEASL